MKKIIKNLMGIALGLILSVTCGSTIVHAAPAPSLTSVSITDVTADQNDKVYIEVTEVGTSKMRFVYSNNQLLEENLNEMVSLDFNGDRIIDGYRRYFYTGYSVSDLYPGLQFNVRAEFTNAMYPWDTKYANQVFTFN